MNASSTAMPTHVSPSRLAAVLLLFATGATASEAPSGPGMSNANKERLVLDDMEDVSDWSNGSPDETTLSASDAHAKEGRFALKFGNLIDHTKGEKNYPIGWPRTSKDLAKPRMTDWSGYDFFECWIYVDTSRDALPPSPVGIGLYHSGQKQTTHIPLAEVRRDAWVKIVLPVDKIADPRDVQRIQFNISESNYKHGDRVDFYLDDAVLTRFVQPAIAELAVDRKVVFSRDGVVMAQYKLVGRKGLEETLAELEIGTGDAAQGAKATAKAARRGEISVAIRSPLSPGSYWGRLSLRDPSGRLFDRKEAEFRVIRGPFDATQ